MKQQKKANEWNTDEFLIHLEELFVDKDASSKAQAALNKLHQGHRQSFAQFRSIFEQLCSEADELTPVGPSKIERMKDALQPHLRAGLAYRKGVSKTNYEQFVAEVQDLANELETIPQFGTSRGSIQVVKNYDNQPYRTLDAVPKESFSPPQNLPAAPTPIHDRDGDTIMTDISALQGQVASLLAAFSRNEGKGHTRNTARASDNRPFPPNLSQNERNQRIDSGRCERCGCSPSHRWSECQFRNFQNNPTPKGYSSHRRAGLNVASTDLASSYSLSNDSGNE
ncbi:hypothetical protein K3495_g2171 [Podosphaera aphanis]|nr:hypothetical protein K3495_g2171 [Podosphaera aphanis]